MSQYVIASRLRKLVKEKGHRLGADFLAALDAFVETKVGQACEIHNGGKITLDAAVATYIGLKKGV